ncbi:MAG TPA: biopolymer transporter ExbD [Chthoniobacterales bacterium]|jgi:biopolymer transport protein ExbD|nr:biopolymer transporter ExbD [Chthoniobacterales bacterium]
MHFTSPVPKKRARIEIIPLIDIMFFLLASFMMVSLSQVHMKGIRVNLPAMVAPTQPLPTPDPRDRLSLFVDPDGLVHFDKEVVTDGDVMPRLLALYKGNPDVKVFISADREALHGDVMKLLDRVRSAGIEKVAYEIKIKHGSAGAPGTPGAPGVQAPAGAPGAAGAAPPPPPPPPPPSP